LYWVKTFPVLWTPLVVLSINLILFGGSTVGLTQLFSYLVAKVQHKSMTDPDVLRITRIAFCVISALVVFGWLWIVKRLGGYQWTVHIPYL
jgi:hypothetical protein